MIFNQPKYILYLLLEFSLACVYSARIDETIIYVVVKHTVHEANLRTICKIDSFQVTMFVII